MLKNLWYGIEFSSVLGATPIKLGILGQKLVAYRRSNGTPVLLQDTCPMCGAPLSQGQIQGDDIACARGDALTLSVVDPEADFSYDFHDLAFTRVGDCR